MSEKANNTPPRCKHTIDLVDGVTDVERGDQLELFEEVHRPLPPAIHLHSQSTVVAHSQKDRRQTKCERSHGGEECETDKDKPQESLK